MTNKSNILIFHSVVKDNDFDVIGLSSVQFDRIIKYLKKIKQHSRLNAHLNPAPENQGKRKFILTFDDGYADNYENAMPVLQRHEVSATFFIASGYLDGGWMWNDGIIEAIVKTSKRQLDLTMLGYEKYSLESMMERKICISDVIGKVKYLPPEKRTSLAKQILERADVEEPTHLMMTSQQVRLMHQAGMEIGGHTVNHPILTCIDKTTARREIFENKEYLESLIGEPLRSFAYPNGKPGKDYGPEHVQMVKEAGYKCAVSTAWGRVNKNSDPYQLPRFTPWDKNPWTFMLRLYLQRLDREERV